MLTLVQQFIRDECSDYVRDQVGTALRSVRDRSAPPVVRFEYNRFELTIDAEKQVAVVQDVLDASDEGVQTVTLDELQSILDATAEGTGPKPPK